MKRLIYFSSLYLVIQGEARLDSYRLENTLENPNIGLSHISITRDMLDMTTDHITKRYFFNTPFEVLKPNRMEITIAIGTILVTDIQ